MHTGTRKRPPKLKYGLLLLPLLFIQACASNIPQEIRNAPVNDICLVQVRQTPSAFIGKSVRWGGTIINIENRPQESRLTILAQPFAAYGEPIQGDQSFGRFIAIVDAFLDPAIYAEGRAVTVYGQLRASEKKKIDEFDYTYAVVKAKQIYLWEPRPDLDHDLHPFWWHDPWYPYYPYRRHYLR